ncbi:IS21 family transposase [Sulfobacillus thermosulfidooxidans]|uniref:IS21 family transposase n=1 Tax=Sulfobacillus thermosulfidooxidans TaxID=28034 RepID=UPI000AB4A340|nr:IS21 family transposase [Sulfobacillus thermosulfidooxidans]
MMMHEQKQTITAIQAATGRDRKTIRKVVTDQKHGHDLTRRTRESQLDPYKEYIEERWNQGCQNAVVLWEEARAHGYTGSLSLIKQLVQPLRPQRGVEPAQRYETDPGDQAQCDWADFGALVYPDQRRKLYIFIYTMSFSRRMSGEFVHDQRQTTLFRCLENAFAYFGCVPTTILSDNMKPMVIDHPRGGEIVWNPRFTAFAEFHGFGPKAARPYRAKTKGKVERSVLYVRQNFWPRIPEVITLKELNVRVMVWAQERDLRIHGTTFERPTDRWEADVAGAQPYDLTRLWAFGEQFPRKVTRDAFVHWQGHRFAVPWTAAGTMVYVRRYSETGIVIGQETQELTRYAIPSRPHQIVGTETWHQDAPPERIPGQPIARRRTLRTPEEDLPTIRLLADYAEVVPQ